MRVLTPLFVLAAGCAPAASDLWPTLEPHPLAHPADVERGATTVLLPLQVYLWTSWFAGCEPPDCPSARRVGDTVEVRGDCTDGDGVAWSGGMTIEQSGDDAEEHVYDDFGWERDGAAVAIDGRQGLEQADGEVVLDSTGLRLFFSGDDPTPLPWPGGTASLEYGPTELLVEDDTWSVRGALLAEWDSGAAGWLDLAGSGWADEVQELHGSVDISGQLLDVRGTADEPRLFAQ